MKKALLAAAVLMFAYAIAAAAVETPATVNLKEAWSTARLSDSQKAVIFKHAFHQEKNICTDCHATDQGGKFTPPGEIKGMNNKNAAHKFCWGTCHEEKKVSVGKICSKCHTE